MIKRSLLFFLAIALLGITSEMSQAQTAWTQLPRPAASRILAVKFLDPTNGFLAITPDNTLSDSLLQTNDGGLSWSRVLLPIDTPYKIRFVETNHNDVWIGALATANGATANRAPARLLRSSNGGANWIVQKIDTSWYPTEISFGGNNEAYLYTRSYRSGKRLAYSSDNGATWDTTNTTLQGNGYYNVRAGYSASVSVSFWNAVAQKEQRIHSTDRGATFNNVPGTNAVYAGDRVWVAGLHRSLDDGRTWSDFDGTTSFAWADTTGDIYSLTFGGDSLWVSHDRGATHTIYPFYRGVRPNQIEVIDNRIAFAANGNTLYKTLTGGKGDFSGIKTEMSSRLHYWIDGSTLRLNSEPTIACPSIELLDLLGNSRIKIDVTHAQTASLDLSWLPRGLYFLRVGTTLRRLAW